MTKTIKLSLVVGIAGAVLLSLIIYEYKSIVEIKKEPIESIPVGTDMEKWKKDKIECESRGMKWIYQAYGLRGDYHCSNVYKDAGKKCNNSDECEGNCILSRKDASPVCEQDDNCNYTEYNDGKLTDGCGGLL